MAAAQRADYHRLTHLHKAQCAARGALEAELTRLQQRVRALRPRPV